MTVRFRHGDLHLVILALLSRQPMHGYQLMGELSERLSPHYRPSPGSIYPALQAMETEGLITSTTDGDRRVYELTGDGAVAYVRRADRLATLEARLGVRFAWGIDVVLARFARRVRVAARQLDEGVVEKILDETAEKIGSMIREGDN